MSVQTKSASASGLGATERPSLPIEIEEADLFLECPTSPATSDLSWLIFVFSGYPHDEAVCGSTRTDMELVLNDSRGVGVGFEGTEDSGREEARDVFDHTGPDGEESSVSPGLDSYPSIDMGGRLSLLVKSLISESSVANDGVTANPRLRQGWGLCQSTRGGMPSMLS